MRDIREDLRQRLQSIAAQRGEMQARLQWLDQAETHIKGLLEYERIQAELNQEPLFAEPIRPDEDRTEIAQFLRDALADGAPRSLDDLKKAAAVRSINFHEKIPGRVLHFALLGMAQGGVVEMVDKGVWKLKTEIQASPEVEEEGIRNGSPRARAM